MRLILREARELDRHKVQGYERTVMKDNLRHNRAPAERPGVGRDRARRRRSNNGAEAQGVSTELSSQVEAVESGYGMPATDTRRPGGMVTDLGAAKDLPAMRGPREKRAGERGAKYARALQFLAPHVKRILYRPAAGSPLIGETGVAESNVSELVDVLRKRSSQPEARGARLAGRLLQRLTMESAPGPTTVAGVKVAQLSRLVELLREADSPGNR